MLQLCISQNISTTPYTFKSTGIKVYSIEEALYHAYHYWRESVDEFLENDLSAWVAGLGIPHITASMKEIAHLNPISRRLIAFLNIAEYFSEAELTTLKTDLERWEHRVEWEKLKDRADHLVSRGEPARALPMYRRALSYEENPALLNNMAIANMQLSNHKEAVSLLAKAMADPSHNPAIARHYAEALILNGDCEDAKKALQKLSNSRRAGASAPPAEAAEINYLHGLMAYQQEDYPTALSHFQKAAHDDPKVYVKMAETYRQMYQYDKALSTLERSPGAPHHIEMAEIYAAYGHAHMPNAIHHVRQALAENDNPTLWAKLAEYYRKDYDHERANEAISRALPSKNPAILLENARIKKALGRTREYRTGLSETLKIIKERYREDG